MTTSFQKHYSMIEFECRSNMLLCVYVNKKMLIKAFYIFILLTIIFSIPLVLKYGTTNITASIRARISAND